MKSKTLVPVCGVVAALIASCAQIEGPRGGEPDRSPPHVIATEPEAMAVVPGWKGPVVIRFDERISQQQVEQSVTVSPEQGEVRVEKGRRELRVTVEGGWKPGRIYRIEVLPVIRDLFNNTRQEPLDLIFSTGPPIPNTALAGMLMDRLTGKPVAEARVEATRRMDSVTYVAVTDTAGFFALRHIPAGAYDLRAYVDRNRNRQADFEEFRDSSAISLGVSDTAVVNFELLPGDTTPARLVRAEAVDSLHLRLHFDDYMNPEDSLESFRVELFQLPDSTPVAVGELLWPHEYERRQAERQAAMRAMADSAGLAAADSIGAGADTLSTVAAPSDRTDPDTERGPGGGITELADTDAAGADTLPPLPTREIVVVPAAPLLPETDFTVVVGEIRNLHGLVGGGGEADFRTPKLPAPVDSVAPDSAGVEQPDSIPGAAGAPSGSGAGIDRGRAREAGLSHPSGAPRRAGARTGPSRPSRRSEGQAPSSGANRRSGRWAGRR